MLNALNKQFETEAESKEEELISNIQFWSSLNKLSESEKMTADQIKIQKSKAINNIGCCFLKFHEDRWALTCFLLAFDNFRYKIQIC